MTARITILIVLVSMVGYGTLHGADDQPAALPRAADNVLRQLAQKVKLADQRYQSQLKTIENVRKQAVDQARKRCVVELEKEKATKRTRNSPEPVRPRKGA